MGLKTAMFAIGAASLVAVPVAAEATPASASVAQVATVSGMGARLSANVKKRQNAVPGGTVALVAGVGAAGLGIAAAAGAFDGSKGG